MKKILLLGGSGFVGRHLCEKLARASCRITVPTRRAANASAVQPLPGLTVLTADLFDDTQLRELVNGHDAVVNLVAILHGTEASFERAHLTLPQKIAQACRATGVKRLVHVSALGAALDAPSMYQRSKARGEAVLQDAGLDLTVLRPSVIFGDGDRFLTLFAKLQQLAPVVPLAGASTRFQPVWVEDVAQAIANCLLGAAHLAPSATVGQRYDLCGPDVMTLAELVRFAGAASGISGGRPVLPLPAALGRLQASLMRLMPGEPLLSHDNLDSMKVDNVCDGTLPGLAELDITPAALSAVAPGYLSTATTSTGLNRFRRTAGR
jgi:NADH dehydrogenase